MQLSSSFLGWLRAVTAQGFRAQLSKSLEMPMRLSRSRQGKTRAQMPCLQLRTSQAMHPGLLCYFTHHGLLPRLIWIAAFLTSVSKCWPCSRWAAPPLLLFPFQHGKPHYTDGTGFRMTGRATAISRNHPAP